LNLGQFRKGGFAALQIRGTFIYEKGHPAAKRKEELGRERGSEKGGCQRKSVQRKGRRFFGHDFSTKKKGKKNTGRRQKSHGKGGLGRKKKEKRTGIKGDPLERRKKGCPGQGRLGNGVREKTKKRVARKGNSNIRWDKTKTAKSKKKVRKKRASGSSRKHSRVKN